VFSFSVFFNPKAISRSPLKLLRPRAFLRDPIEQWWHQLVESWEPRNVDDFYLVCPDESFLAGLKRNRLAYEKAFRAEVTDPDANQG